VAAHLPVARAVRQGRANPDAVRLPRSARSRALWRSGSRSVATAAGRRRRCGCRAPLGRERCGGAAPAWQPGRSPAARSRGGAPKRIRVDRLLPGSPRRRARLPPRPAARAPAAARFAPAAARVRARGWAIYPGHFVISRPTPSGASRESDEGEGMRRRCLRQRTSGRGPEGVGRVVARMVPQLAQPPRVRHGRVTSVTGCGARPGRPGCQTVDVPRRPARSSGTPPGPGHPGCQTVGVPRRPARPSGTPRRRRGDGGARRTYRLSR
jgi:hypothetical protein